MDLPGDLPVVERDAVRLVVVDVHERVLLIHIHEPRHPELGTVWELPGGGIDADETYVDAALRELREETGIRAGPADLGAPTWRRRATFQHAGARRIQNEVVVLVRLSQSSPPVDQTAQLADELETYLGFHWWSVPDIQVSTERFYPGQLPQLVRPFLDGDRIEEPFEFFS